MSVQDSHPANQLTGSDLIVHAKKVANSIYVAADQAVALDVSNTIRQLIVEIEGYRAELWALSGSLNKIRAGIEHSLAPHSGFATGVSDG